MHQKSCFWTKNSLLWHYSTEKNMKNMQNIPKFYDVGLKSVSVSVLPTFQNVGVGVGRHQNHGVGESLSMGKITKYW